VKVRDFAAGNILSVEPETPIAEVAATCERPTPTVSRSCLRVASWGSSRSGISCGHRWTVIDPREARADVVMTADPATVDADEMWRWWP